MPYYPERKPPADKPAGPEDREKPKQDRPEQGASKKNDPNRWIRIGLLSLSLVLILYGGIRLIIYGSEWLSARNTSQELREAAEEPVPTPTEGMPWDQPEALQPESPAAETETAEAAEDVRPEGTEIPGETAIPEETVKPPATAEAATDAQAAVKEDLLPEIPYPENPGLNVPERFQRLLKKSESIVGWLKMVQVDEAVVKKDNTYYLTHDALGKRNSNGAIFMDESTMLLTRPYTIMLYGHNMRSGAMFGHLKKFRDPAYAFQNRIVQLDTIFEEGTYAVFAAGVVSLIPGASHYVSLYGLASRSRSARETALAAMISASDISCVLDVGVEDQLLLLITCVDDDNERLVVAARRLREGETENSLTMRR